MDGSGAGGLSGLIDEVRADGRRVTRGGRRRARGGRRPQTRRRSGSAPGRPRPPLRRAPARLRRGGGGCGSASRAWRPRARGPLPQRGRLASRPPLARAPSLGAAAAASSRRRHLPGRAPSPARPAPGPSLLPGRRGRCWRPRLRRPPARPPGEECLSQVKGPRPARRDRRHKSQRQHSLGGERSVSRRSRRA